MGVWAVSADYLSSIDRRPYLVPGTINGRPVVAEVDSCTISGVEDDRIRLVPAPRPNRKQRLAAKAERRKLGRKLKISADQNGPTKE